MRDPFFKPVSGFDLPRFAGVPTFMRLPHVSLDATKIKDVDIGIIGVPGTVEQQIDLGLVTALVNCVTPQP